MGGEGPQSLRTLGGGGGGQISEEEYAAFKLELNKFEDWLEENVDRELEFQARVDGVKPLFRKKVFNKGEGVSFSGFLLIFSSAYLGYTHMEDYVYARISTKSYASLKFGRGDKLTARAILTLDNGRLVLTRVHHIEIEERGEPPIWDESKALVARETATQLSHQPEGCLRCPQGALIDVEDMSRPETKKYRQLYCLKGIQHYQLCLDYMHFMNLQESESAKRKKPAACQTRRVNVHK